MRLLIIGSTPVHLINYIRLIKDDTIEVAVVSNEIINSEWIDHSYAISIAWRKLIDIPFNYFKLKKLIQDYNPDVVHLHQISTIGLFVSMMKARMHFSLVATAWGSDVLVAPFKSKFIKWQVVKTLRQADYLTSDSKHMASVMNNLAGMNRKIEIVNFGVDEELFEADITSKENLIFSNRLHKKNYRIDTIIRLFHAFIGGTNEQGWRLIVAATGDETESLKNLVSELGIANHVDFVGWLSKEENIKYYRRSKVFMSIPISDATSISLLEAMAAGCIPIVSDLPANREWIEHRSNGIIYSDDQGDIINEALRLDSNNVASINKKNIYQTSSKEICRNKFLSIYNQALSG